ncbi:hypothetical protein ACPIE3_004782, partial [Escherichia coli]
SYAAGFFSIHSTAERAIHSIISSVRDDDLCSVFYVEARAFPINIFAEEGLNVIVPTADYAVGQTTYKWGATDPLSESTNAQIILDFKNGRGYYCSHPFISSLSGNAATATKLQTACTINGVSFDGTKDITLTPKDLDAYSKSEVQSALAGKQPLDNTLTNLSGKDVAGLLAYLGLGEAAKRNVGTGANQIPDMGSFTLSVSDTGYQKLPSGFILQWGSIGAPGIAQDVVTHFPIAFPNRCLRVLVSQDYTPGSGDVGYIACAGFSPDPVKFISRASTPGLGASFLALGC